MRLTPEATPETAGSEAVKVTGVAGVPVHGEDAEALMKKADAALYEAKRSGKNTARLAV